MASATPQQKRLTLIACILGSATVFIDGTIVNVALADIRSDLNAGLATQQWVVEAYLLTLGSLILIGGSLSDHLGRRRVFAFGTAAFGATSLLCAVAPNAEFLIAARALQGVAGAILVPGTLALIMSVFPEDERGRAIGTWTAWTGVATVIGPLAGGVLLGVGSWRWVFGISLIPVAATLFLIPRALPAELDQPSEPGRLDFLGAVLCALGLAGLVFALIQQPTKGWRDPQVAVSLVVAAVMLPAFVWHEHRTSSPMVPLSMFRVRNFAVGNVATFFTYAGLGAAIFLIVLYLQQIGGWSALGAGFVLLPVTVLMFLLSSRFGALADRIGPRPLMGAGPIVAGTGLLLLLRIDQDPSYVTELLPGVALFGLGLAMTVAPLTATVLADVDERDAGIASAVNNAIARVAGLVAIAAIGAIVASQYDARLMEALGGTGEQPAVRAAVGALGSRPFAVEVPPGKHSLALRYEDSWFPVGVAVSLLSIIALSVFAWRFRPANSET